MWTTRRFPVALILVSICLLADFTAAALDDSSLATTKIENGTLLIEANPKAGAYTIRSKRNPRVWFTATVAAQVDHRWLRSTDYPQHEIRESDDPSAGSQLTITYNGLSSQPDLVCSLRLRPQSAFAEIEVLFMLLPAWQAGEPFGLRLLFRKGVEHAYRRMLPVTRDDKASMGDRARHQAVSLA